MLRVCHEKEFYQYADLAYELAIDKTRSAYPSYSDGIKTKAMFLTRSKKAFTRDNEEILLFEDEGLIKGWIHYYWLADDKYISTVSFNIANHFARALDEFIKLLGDRFSGYELYLGFSKENRMAIAYMANNDFKCIDISNNNTAFLDKMIGS